MAEMLPDPFRGLTSRLILTEVGVTIDKWFLPYLQWPKSSVTVNYDEIASVSLTLNPRITQTMNEWMAWYKVFSVGKSQHTIFPSLAISVKHPAPFWKLDVHNQFTFSSVKQGELEQAKAFIESRIALSA